MKRSCLLIAMLSLAGCASEPRTAETIWVNVNDVYSAKELGQWFYKPIAERFASAGFTEKDIEAGRLLRVSCGLGTDYSWGSYAYLPPGTHVRKDEVVRLRVTEPTTNERMGINPVTSRVAEFKFPGLLTAYRYISDWRERGLFLNYERLPLDPGQEGRYSIVHGSYVIKCRQGE